MKVTRFCSQEEHDKFCRGEILVNTTDHFKDGKTSGSTSRGFCFTTDDPKTAWEYLKGIVSPDVCMVLDIHPVNLKEGRGVYVERDEACNQKSVYRKEWYTKMYSNHSTNLLEVHYPAESDPDGYVAAKLIEQLKKQIQK